MTLTAALVLIPGLCYFAAAAMYAYQRNWPLCITFAGYSFSNCGLLWLDRIMAK